MELSTATVVVAGLGVSCTSALEVLRQSARIHLIAGAGYDLHVYQSLDSLMYRCTRDSADHCDIFGRYAGIAHNDIQDLFVEIVY